MASKSIKWELRNGCFSFFIPITEIELWYERPSFSLTERSQSLRRVGSKVESGRKQTTKGCVRVERINESSPLLWRVGGYTNWLKKNSPFGVLDFWQPWPWNFDSVLGTAPWLENEAWLCNSSIAIAKRFSIPCLHPFDVGDRNRCPFTEGRNQSVDLGFHLCLSILPRFGWCTQCDASLRAMTWEQSCQ